MTGILTPVSTACDSGRSATLSIGLHSRLYDRTRKPLMYCFKVVDCEGEREEGL